MTVLVHQLLQLCKLRLRSKSVMCTIRRQRQDISAQGKSSAQTGRHHRLVSHFLHTTRSPACYTPMTLEDHNQATKVPAHKQAVHVQKLKQKHRHSCILTSSASTALAICSPRFVRASATADFSCGDGSCDLQTHVLCRCRSDGRQLLNMVVACVHCACRACTGCSVSRMQHIRPGRFERSAVNHQRM